MAAKGRRPKKSLAANLTAASRRAVAAWASHPDVLRVCAQGTPIKIHAQKLLEPLGELDQERILLFTSEAWSTSLVKDDGTGVASPFEGFAQTDIAVRWRLFLIGVAQLLKKHGTPIADPTKLEVATVLAEALWGEWDGDLDRLNVLPRGSYPPGGGGATWTVGATSQEVNDLTVLSHQAGPPAPYAAGGKRRKTPYAAAQLAAYGALFHAGKRTTRDIWAAYDDLNDHRADALRDFYAEHDSAPSDRSIQRALQQLRSSQG